MWQINAAYQGFRAEAVDFRSGWILGQRDWRGFTRCKRLARLERIAVDIRMRTLQQMHEAFCAGINDTGSAQRRQQVRRALERLLGFHQQGREQVGEVQSLERGAS